MATKTCPDCKRIFEYTPPTDFPDKRKYCDDCSERRKKEFEAKKNGVYKGEARLIPVKEATQNQSVNNLRSNEHISVASETIVLTRTDKPHSYEFGKASARHKIYYNTIEELNEHIKKLEYFGLSSDGLEEFKQP